MGWPVVALGEVAKRVKRSETPEPGTPYRQIGVRLWGQGAYQRETVDGSETRYPVFYRVQKDDIIVNKIWARNGSVAVVTANLDGSFGSAEFPTYEVDRTVLLPGWFAWFTKTPELWAQCDNLSRGTSGQNRLRPERFLDVHLPLPPLNEQQRIVAKLDKVAGLVGEAKAINANIRHEVQVLLRALVHGAPEQSTQRFPLEKSRYSGLLILKSSPILSISLRECIASGGAFFGVEPKQVPRSATKNSSALSETILPIPNLWLGKGHSELFPRNVWAAMYRPSFPCFRSTRKSCTPKLSMPTSKTPWFGRVLSARAKGQTLAVAAYTRTLFAPTAYLFHQKVFNRRSGILSND